MRQPFSFRLVLRCVALAFDVTENDLRSARRTADVVEARQALYWLARGMSTLSLPAIGRLIGRDHTTLLHGIRAVDERRAADPEFAAKLEGVARAVNRITASDIAVNFFDPNVITVAERVVSAPMREAMRVSTSEIVAVAARLIELEELARATFVLVTRLDDLKTSAFSPSRKESAANVQALTETITSALMALGYSSETETNDEGGKEDQDACGDSARTAE